MMLISFHGYLHGLLCQKREPACDLHASIDTKTKPGQLHVAWVAHSSVAAPGTRCIPRQQRTLTPLLGVRVEAALGLPTQILHSTDADSRMQVERHRTRGLVLVCRDCDGQQVNLRRQISMYTSRQNICASSQTAAKDLWVAARSILLGPAANSHIRHIPALPAGAHP